MILDIWVFDSFILIGELLTKALSVDNNLRGKRISLSVPIIFDYNLKAFHVAFFVADFNSSGCESVSFTFTLLY